MPLGMRLLDCFFCLPSKGELHVLRLNHIRFLHAEASQ